jgi:hypothetical protein
VCTDACEYFSIKKPACLARRLLFCSLGFEIDFFSSGSFFCDFLCSLVAALALAVAITIAIALVAVTFAIALITIAIAIAAALALTTVQGLLCPCDNALTVSGSQIDGTGNSGQSYNNLHNNAKNLHKTLPP